MPEGAQQRIHLPAKNAKYQRQQSEQQCVKESISDILNSVKCRASSKRGFRRRLFSTIPITETLASPIWAATGRNDTGTE